MNDRRRLMAYNDGGVLAKLDGCGLIKYPRRYRPSDGLVLVKRDGRIAGHVNRIDIYIQALVHVDECVSMTLSEYSLITSVSATV